LDVLSTTPPAGKSGSDYLITAGTTYRKFSLDNLQTAIPSANAAVVTDIGTGSTFKNDLNLTGGSSGVNFQTAPTFTDDDLFEMFEVKVDGSNWKKISLPRMMSMSHLESTVGPGAIGDQTLSGKKIATELTNELNKTFGDSKIFDFSGIVAGNLTIKRYATGATFPIIAGDSIAVNIEGILETAIELAAMNDGSGAAGTRKAEGWQLAHAMTLNIRTNAGWGDITVEYDEKNQGFKFHQTQGTPDTIRIGATVAAGAAVFGNIAIVAGGDRTNSGTLLTPKTVNGSAQLLENVIGNGAAITAADRRSGIEVTYAGGKFNFKSGTTGDGSSIEVRAKETAVSAARADNLAVAAYTPGGLVAKSLLGIVADTTKTRTENNKNQITAAVTSLVENLPTVRGQASTAAVLTGNAMGVDTEQAFNVSAANQSVTAVIDGVTSTVKLTLGQYNIDTFTVELQTQLNRMADANGKTVSNITVGFDTAKTALTVTGATTSSKSFIQMLGSQDWGLTDVPVAFGSSSTYAKIDSDQQVGSNLYVSEDPATGQWNESVDKADFDAGNIPYWTPIFLDRGEITFDSSGSLVSPQAKYKLESKIATGNTIEVAYTGSTQYNSAFAAISQSQNGQPEGDLNGISIGDDGLIIGSYSNGTQKSLGKIVIANFNSAAGLKQLGDSSWTASAESGAARLGEAGAAGYGTIRSGSRERSNVDLTTELVDLIAAQRNFQANAKAIETNSAMTSAIINIRG